jgi:hypothetical protein
MITRDPIKPAAISIIVYNLSQNRMYRRHNPKKIITIRT